MNSKAHLYLSSAQQVALVVLRTLIGWHFLYEGYYKLILPAWGSDGRPLPPWTSTGYLKAASGPLARVFQWLIDAGWIGWIDMTVKLSLLLIGLSLWQAHIDFFRAAAGAATERGAQPGINLWDAGRRKEGRCDAVPAANGGHLFQIAEGFLPPPPHAVIQALTPVIAASTTWIAFAFSFTEPPIRSSRRRRAGVSARAQSMRRARADGRAAARAAARNGVETMPLGRGREGACARGGARGRERERGRERGPLVNGALSS